MASSSDPAPLLPGSLRARLDAWLQGVLGYVLLAGCVAAAASLLTWSITDPSFTRATSAPARNLLGPVGATFSDLVMRLFGLAGVFIVLPPTFWALQLITRRRLEGARLKLTLAPLAVLLVACAASSLPSIPAWPLPNGLGGFLGDQTLRLLTGLLATVRPERATALVGVSAFAAGMLLLMASLGMSPGDVKLIYQSRKRLRLQLIARAWRWLRRALDHDRPAPAFRHEPTLDLPPFARRPASRLDASLGWEPRMASASLAPSGELNPARTAPDSEFDGVTDQTCHAMAQRFAPDLDQPRGTMASGLLSRRAGRAPAREAGARVEGMSYRPGGSPAWAPGSAARSSAARRARLRSIGPGTAPTAGEAETPPTGRHRHGRPDGDKLYIRAVAIVRADRKASTDHLQQRLGIGYMQAADLIERMEQEGILGARGLDGERPILYRGRRQRIV